MTAADVSKRIADEIATVGENWFAEHGLSISRCLVHPERVTCTNTFPAFRGGKPFEAWLVLEELSNNDDGYRIIFDEETDEFGLACGTRSDPVFIGFHGSFINTVQGM